MHAYEIFFTTRNRDFIIGQQVSDVLQVKFIVPQQIIKLTTYLFT